MSELAKLIERVEQATGPDRELDAAILKHLGGDPWAGRVRFPSGEGRWYDGGSSDITASIDAALALTDRLLPTGWCWKIAFEERRYTFVLRNSDFLHQVAPAWVASSSLAPFAIILATLHALKARQP
jgi:hypothetical protein